MFDSIAGLDVSTFQMARVFFLNDITVYSFSLTIMFHGVTIFETKGLTAEDITVKSTNEAYNPLV